MNHPIDSLFKSKLEQHTIPVSGRMWTRIESGLNNSSNQKFYMKFAAGIALFATASALIIYLVSAEEQPLAQQPAQTATPALNTPPYKPQETLVPLQPAAKSKQVQTVFKPASAHLAMAEEQAENIPAESDSTADDQKEAIAQPATGLVIVLTSEEVNAKYLLKTGETQATSEQKKSSRLQKFAALAHNLSNEDILGDLRDRKNELFAFNFLDDKKGKKN